jgi:signal transduction histidine kinase
MYNSLILIFTLLLILTSSLLVFVLFLSQRRRYRHQQEIAALSETFSNTLLQSKLEIQEQTLNHIARELHDNFNTTLSFINMNLSSMTADKPEDLREKIIETKALAKELIGAFKALTMSLNSDQILRHGFKQSIENEIIRLNKIGRQKTQLNITGNEIYLAPEKAIILFRIYQEALNNIIKHAKATEINISLLYQNDTLTLTIADNGIGFDVESIQHDPEKQQSMGLRNIINRSQLIDAATDIKSSPGKGTSITVIIPKPNEQAHVNPITH